jgi:protein tyrosine phosphatase
MRACSPWANAFQELEVVLDERYTAYSECTPEASSEKETLFAQGASCSVAHFHYHAWPDHGVPASSRPLRDLVASVQALQRDAPAAGPPVVHCSAGACPAGAAAWPKGCCDPHSKSL